MRERCKPTDERVAKYSMRLFLNHSTPCGKSVCKNQGTMNFKVERENEGDKKGENVTRLTRQSTVGQNSQELGRKYWATRSSVRSFARTAHLFACSALLPSLARSIALTRSLARSLLSLPHSWKSELLMSQNDLNLPHSAVVIQRSRRTHNHVSGRVVLANTSLWRRLCVRLDRAQ